MQLQSSTWIKQCVAGYTVHAPACISSFACTLACEGYLYVYREVDCKLTPGQLLTVMFCVCHFLVSNRLLTPTSCLSGSTGVLAGSHRPCSLAPSKASFHLAVMRLAETVMGLAVLTGDPVGSNSRASTCCGNTCMCKLHHVASS